MWELTFSKDGNYKVIIVDSLDYEEIFTSNGWKLVSRKILSHSELYKIYQSVPPKNL